METNEEKPQYVAMSEEEIKEQGVALVDKLLEVFDGKRVIAIAAAIHAFLKNAPDVGRAIARMAFDSLERSVGKECDCPRYTADRAAKRGQA